jgi:hypothetical protein
MADIILVDLERLRLDIGTADVDRDDCLGAAEVGVSCGVVGGAVDFTDTRLGAFLGFGSSSTSADLFLLTEFLVEADIALSAQNGVGS